MQDIKTKKDKKNMINKISHAEIVTKTHTHTQKITIDLIKPS